MSFFGMGGAGAGGGMGMGWLQSLFGGGGAGAGSAPTGSAGGVMVPNSSGLPMMMGGPLQTSGYGQGPQSFGGVPQSSIFQSAAPQGSMQGMLGALPFLKGLVPDQQVQQNAQAPLTPGHLVGYEGPIRGPAPLPR